MFWWLDCGAMRFGGGVSRWRLCSHAGPEGQGKVNAGGALAAATETIPVLPFRQLFSSLQLVRVLAARGLQHKHGFITTASVASWLSQRNRLSLSTPQPIPIHSVLASLSSGASSTSTTGGNEDKTPDRVRAEAHTIHHNSLPRPVGLSSECKVAEASAHGVCTGGQKRQVLYKASGCEKCS